MKKTVLTALAVASLVAGYGATAAAQPYRPPPGVAAQTDPWPIDRKVEWLESRIRQGRNDGSLSEQEFRRVQGELEHINRDFVYLRNLDGGWIGPHHRMEIERRLNHVSNGIYWLRHNDVVRPW
jgi:hypothetical protein